MLPPKKQSLFPPFATTFDGDTATCSQHLGRARGILSLMLRSTPPVKSRIEKTSDVEIRVTTNPNHVYIKDASATLYCTSFNGGDLGTQVYKKPFPPITRGGLISDGVNPDMPDYHARTNYWVDDKEKNTVSWEYVTRIESGVSKSRGKISIQGLEGNIGLYVQPLAVGLISDTKLLVVSHYWLGSGGSGRYAIVYNYALDFVGETITLSIYSTYKLNSVTYGTVTIHGILDDHCQTVIYSDSSDLKYFTINYTGDSIINNISGNGVIHSLSGNIWMLGKIDVRGNTVAYCYLETTSSSSVYIGDYPASNGTTYTFCFSYNATYSTAFYLWDGITQSNSLIASYIGSSSGIGNPFGTIEETFDATYPLLHTKYKANIHIKANWIIGAETGMYGKYLAVSYDVYSSKYGLLIARNLAEIVGGVDANGQISFHNILDYSYTERDVIVYLNALAGYVAGGAGAAYPESKVSVILSNSKRIINNETLTLSVTNLPVTP